MYVAGRAGQLWLTKKPYYNLVVGEEKPLRAVTCTVAEQWAGQSPLQGAGAPVFVRSPAWLWRFLVDQVLAISIVALSARHPIG